MFGTKSVLTKCDLWYSFVVKFFTAFFALSNILYVTTIINTFIFVVCKNATLQNVSCIWFLFFCVLVLLSYWQCTQAFVAVYLYFIIFQLWCLKLTKFLLKYNSDHLNLITNNNGWLKKCSGIQWLFEKIFNQCGKRGGQIWNKINISSIGWDLSRHWTKPVLLV